MKEGKVKLNIYLIRHGEKSKDGQSLTARGRKQVEFLVKRLQKLRITKIFSSNLERCMITTKIISKTIKKPVYYESALREISGEANWESKRYKKENEIIGKFFNKLKKENGNILIIASGNVNRNLIARVLEISPKKVKIIQIPTGLTHIERKENGDLRFVCINDTSHLPDKLKVRQII